MNNKIIERTLSLGDVYDEQSLRGFREVAPSWSMLGAQVREAEAAGYDAVVALEGVNDPYLQLAIAAQQPSSVQLATGIALAFTRSPTQTAYTAWDINRMSGGRLVLGLGSQVKGHIERRFSMPWAKPALRMKEYVQVLRACWHTWQTGAPLQFEGEVYKVTLMPEGVRATPPQKRPGIPVHIAAVQGLMLQVAGEVCDGVRLHDFATRNYIDRIAIPNLRQGFEKSGRPVSDWSEFEIAGGGVVLTAADADGVAKLVRNYRKRGAFYASTPAYREIMALEGWGDVADELHQMSRLQKWDEMEALFTEEMVHRIAVVGRYDDIADAIKTRLYGITRVRISLPVGSERERGVAREIIREIKS